MLVLYLLCILSVSIALKSPAAPSVNIRNTTTANIRNGTVPNIRNGTVPNIRNATAAYIRNATVEICAIVRQEEQYIDEWLRYHQYLGFDRVHLFDNADEPSQYLVGLKAVYGDFLNVTYRPGVRQQLHTYRDFMRAHHTENLWGAFFDIDEFIVLRKHTSIKDFLRDVAPNGGGVVFNWRRFSNNGDKRRTAGPVVARFTHTTKKLSHYTKSISYIPHSEFINVHMTNLKPGYKKVDVQGRPIASALWLLEEHTDNQNVAYVAHYRTKSLEEYVKKRMRGRASRDNRGGNVTYTEIATVFESYNNLYWEVEDTFARDFYLRHYFGSGYQPGNTTKLVVS